MRRPAAQEEEFRRLVAYAARCPAVASPVSSRLQSHYRRIASSHASLVQRACPAVAHAPRQANFQGPLRVIAVSYRCLHRGTRRAPLRVWTPGNGLRTRHGPSARLPKEKHPWSPRRTVSRKSKSSCSCTPKTITAQWPPRRHSISRNASSSPWRCIWARPRSCARPKRLEATSLSEDSRQTGDGLRSANPSWCQ